MFIIEYYIPPLYNAVNIALRPNYTAQDFDNVRVYFGNLLRQVSVADGVGVVDASVIRPLIQSSESVGLSETSTAVLTLHLNQFIALAEALGAQAVYGKHSKTDSLLLAEERALHVTAAQKDDLGLSDAGSVGLVILALQEQVALADSTLARVTATLALSQVLRLAEAVGLAYRLERNDALALAESSTVLAHSLLSLADTLPLRDEAAFQFSVAFLVKDTLPLVDTVGWRIQAILAVSDTLALVGRVQLGVQEYLAWAINTHTGGAYKFSNYRFNSFARVGGKNLFCRADGIYEVAGETDNGALIQGMWKTGKLNLETPDFPGDTLKELLAAYLLFDAEGETLLKLTVSRWDVTEEHWYLLNESAQMAKRQLPISNSIRSVLFQFELNKLDGKPAAFREIEVIPLYLTRRE